MKRRQFLLRSAAAGAAQFAPALVPGVTAGAQHTSSQQQPPLGHTLSELHVMYHRDLFVDWLPFMEQHVIDREYGGFLCNTDFDGTHVDYEKEPLFEGRGMWVYSTLYLRFGRDPRYLEVARRSAELLEKSQPPDDTFWCNTIHRDGSPAGPSGKLIPTDVGIAEGFAAYAQATGKQEYLDRAKRLLRKCIEAYDRPTYNPAVGRTYFGENAPPLPGARIMGSAMIMLRSAAQILAADPDPYFDQFAKRCASIVLEHHFNPRYRLNNELLQHDASLPGTPYDQLVNLGNTLEITWMLLDEATRQHDETMLRTIADRFHRHAEVARDPVYNGVFHTLRNVDQNDYVLTKLLWAQEETLTDALYIYDRLGEPWAAKLFTGMHAYVRRTFPLTAHGSPIWMYQTGRQATFEQFSLLGKRIENYHHPRHLMLTLLRLEAMLH
ncbi:MAG TPA: AGE family epimerase/isomerase [Acidobacteriaceae bacterium]|nr:AGE family epimerase/isomerase [Acidobacteriaceae bacterium]